MLTGLALDAAGFLAGNVPVYGDIANGVLSTIGSNIAYGIADRRMVKAGAAPKGTTLKNIALNVGLDVAGIVPVLGDAANAAGWARKLVQFLKSSSKALE